MQGDLAETIRILRAWRDSKPMLPPRYRDALTHVTDAVEDAREVIAEMVQTQADWEVGVEKVIGRQPNVFPRAIDRGRDWLAKHGGSKQ